MGNADTRPEETAVHYETDLTEVVDHVVPIFNDVAGDGKGGKMPSLDGNGNSATTRDLLKGLRSKRGRAGRQINGDRNNNEVVADDASSSSNDADVRVGKTHRERGRREADDALSAVKPTENTLHIEGDVVPFSGLRLVEDDNIQSVRPAGSEVRIKWYLSDDVGSLDAFAVLPFGSGPKCEVPLAGLGKFVKAERSYKSDYIGTGYDTTVGEALDPLTNEKIKASRQILVKTSATIGPVSLPDDWFDLYCTKLQEESDTQRFDPLILTASVKGEGVGLKMRLLIFGDYIELSPESAQQASETCSRYKLEKILVKLLSSESITMVVLKAKSGESRQKKTIQLTVTHEDEQADLLFQWGYLICAQASSTTRDEGSATLDGSHLKVLFQKWLHKHRLQSLIDIHASPESNH